MAPELISVGVKLTVPRCYELLHGYTQPKKRGWGVGGWGGGGGGGGGRLLLVGALL